jgi:nucleoside-diphosphate-sugar epimerase
MRILVTGASGWIGSASTSELLAAGHQVVGLARSDASEAAIEALGAEVRRGTIDDADSVVAAAEGCDGVVHLAYHHDFSQMAEAAVLDRGVIDAVGDAFADTGKFLFIASGTLGLSAPGQVGTENDQPDPGVHPRVANGQAALDLADRGVRSGAVRFAPTVHGDGDHGFIAVLVGIAREKGVSAYVDEGQNRWPAVHRLDAGRLVALAVESAPAGSVLHAVAEEGITSRAIAEAIGRGLGVPTRSLAADDADAHFGWIGRFFAADAPASHELTSKLLGWEPTHQGLIEDLDEGHYFAAPAS